VKIREKNSEKFIFNGRGKSGVTRLLGGDKGGFGWRKKHVKDKGQFQPLRAKRERFPPKRGGELAEVWKGANRQKRPAFGEKKGEFALGIHPRFPVKSVQIKEPR